MGDWQQIIITIIGVLGSGAAWKFLESRRKLRAYERQSINENSDGVQYRDDLKNRVINLESLLATSATQKDELMDTVLKLTAQVSELNVKVDFLERENERLKNK